MEITKEEFESYVKIQRSGITNMFDVNAVVRLSNGKLTEDKCFEIMSKYSILEEKYNG